jgi:hypothetical protein
MPYFETCVSSPVLVELDLARMPIQTKTAHLRNVSLTHAHGTKRQPFVEVEMVSTQQRIQEMAVRVGIPPMGSNRRKDFAGMHLCFVDDYSLSLVQEI